MISISIRGAEAKRCDACRPRRTAKTKALRITVAADLPGGRRDETITVCTECIVRQLLRFIAHDVARDNIPF